MSNTVLGTRSAAATSFQELHFVSFVVAEQNYGVSVQEVYGIYHGLPVASDSLAGGARAGSVHVSGRHVPVISLRQLCGLADEGGEDSRRWILMVNGPQGTVGLIVDKVTEVVKIPAQSLNPPDAPPCALSAHVAAVTSHRGQPFHILDLQRVLHDASSQS